MKPIQDTLSTALQACTEALNIPLERLEAWVQSHAGVPVWTLLTALHIAQRYGLDPLADEIMIYAHGDDEHQAMITVDGWYRLMNQHPAFTGLSLREAEASIDQAPAWMECCIYRQDRILPIVVREHLVEVRTHHPSWQQMPRRMLRHRVIQQCARLAFGWSAPEFKSMSFHEPSPSTEKNTPSSSPLTPPPRASHRERLKQHLQDQAIKPASSASPSPTSTKTSEESRMNQT